MATVWKTTHTSYKNGTEEMYSEFGDGTTTAAADGEWVDATGFQYLLVQVQEEVATLSSTITISGSMGTDTDFTVPADSADGFSIGTITDAGVFLINMGAGDNGSDDVMPRYIKVHPSTVATGTARIVTKVIRVSS